MFFKERRTTVSLLSQDYLIADASHSARQEQEQIDVILKELHAGNFSHLDEFEQLIDKIFKNIQENIKLYTEREEEERLKILEQVIHEFFQRHLFDHLDDDIIFRIQKDFREKLRIILKELMNEKKIERRLKHGRKPANAYFRKLFFENKQLDRQQLRNARELLELHKDERTTQEQLYNMMQVLIRPKALDTAHERHHEERLLRAFEHFITIVAQEFHALYDIDVDASLQEADLLHDLNWLLKQKKVPREHKKRIKAIKKRVHSYFYKDLRVFKRMLREAKKEQKEISQIHAKKNTYQTKPTSWETNTDDKETRRDIMLIIDKIIEIKESDNSRRVAGLLLLADGAYKAGRNAEKGEYNILGTRDIRHAETDLLIQAIHDRHDVRNGIMYVSDICCLRPLRVDVLEDKANKRYKVENTAKGFVEFFYHGQEQNKDIYELKYNGHSYGLRMLEQVNPNLIVVKEKYVEHGLGIYLPRMLIIKEGKKANIIDGCAFMVQAMGVKKVYYLYGKNQQEDTKKFMEQGVINGEKIPYPLTNTQLIKKDDEIVVKIMELGKKNNATSKDINEMKKLAEEYRKQL